MAGNIGRIRAPLNRVGKSGQGGSVSTAPESRRFPPAGARRTARIDPEPRDGAFAGCDSAGLGADTDEDAVCQFGA